MRTTDLFCLALTAALLAACGSSDEPATSAAGPAPATRSSSSDSRIAATAAEVAEESRGKLRCPAKLKTAPRDASAPVDDVVGVRPGLTYEEAVNVVLCSNDLLIVATGGGRGFKINTYGQTIRQGFGAVFAEDRINKTSKEIMAEMQDEALARGTNRRAPDMPGGTSRWYVTTMGMPGQERVVAAARIEAFAEGKAPPLASVGAALVDKYGTPSTHREDPSTWYYTWTYDAFGRPITETSPLYRQCNGPSGPDDGVNLSPDCGIVITAMIMPMRDNPQLARTMQVGVVQQAQGYESLMATGQQLERQEQKRRADQVEAAAAQADKPTL